MGAKSAELELLVACCAWPHNGRAIDRVATAAAKVEDWEGFSSLVEAHRVDGLAHHAIAVSTAAVPVTLAERFAARAHSLAMLDLRMAAESLRIDRAFAEAGIRMLVLKGVTIGMLAYGRLGLKRSWDIDVLVPPDAMKASCELLIALGYRSRYDSAQFDRFTAVAHEVEFSSDQGLTVELHCRASLNRRLLPDIHSGARTQEVRLAGGALTTLSDGPQLAYLCVHGALHEWSRLKWLADVNAFAASRSTVLEGLFEEAAALGAHRSVSVALRLCRVQFGTDIPPAVERCLDRGPLARLHFRRSLTSSDPAAAERKRTALSLLLQLGLERGSAHAFGQMTALWNNPNDRLRLALPKGAWFLYHVIRVPLFLGRFFRRSARFAEASRIAPSISGSPNR